MVTERESKPRTNLVLVSGEPLLYLKFNKPNQQNVLRLIYLKQPLTHGLMSGMKHQNIKYITLLSDANVPVRLKAQQRAKYTELTTVHGQQYRS